MLKLPFITHLTRRGVLFLVVLGQLLAISQVGGRHRRNNRICSPEGSQRTWIQRPSQDWSISNINNPASDQVWEEYKRLWNLQDRPEFVAFKNEHLARKIFIEKFHVLAAKQRCIPDAPVLDIKVDGNWWKPVSPPSCDCGNELWEQNRFEEYRFKFKKPAYTKVGPFLGYSEYEFRKWIFALKVRQEEFKRCAGLWPNDVEDGFDLGFGEQLPKKPEPKPPVPAPGPEPPGPPVPPGPRPRPEPPRPTPP